jgi:hypothetical protein
VVTRFNRGQRSALIAKDLGITQRTVQKIIRAAIGPMRKRGGKSVEHQLKQMRHLVVCVLQQQGRDFSKCELCAADIPDGKYDLHHTKYEGATIRDVAIVCRACNLSRQNKFLD